MSDLSNGNNINSLTDVLDELVEGTAGEQRVTIGNLLDALNTRSFGPLLVMPALLAVSPVAAIPGVAIVSGAMIILIAVQALAGRAHPWLPKKLLEFSFPQEKLQRDLERARPWIVWSEKAVRQRLTRLTHAPVFHVVAATCTLLAASFFPLELIPMGVFVPGIAVVLFSVGMTTRDGVLIIIAFAITGITAWMTVYLWPF